MDMVKMGRFLAALRKEQQLTQAALGEKLHVTNKTISRWETGTYMPPVEMLEALSQLYGLTINELLSGERLSPERYQEMAETNIRETLKASAFSLKEKQTFWRRKWYREHLLLLIFCVVCWCGVNVVLHLQQVEPAVSGLIVGMLTVLFYLVLYNRMMIYVEKHVFGDLPNGGSNSSNDA